MQIGIKWCILFMIIQWRWLKLDIFMVFFKQPCLFLDRNIFECWIVSWATEYFFKFMFVL